MQELFLIASRLPRSAGAPTIPGRPASAARAAPHGPSPSPVLSQPRAARFPPRGLHRVGQPAQPARGDLRPRAHAQQPRLRLSRGAARRRLPRRLHRRPRTRRERLARGQVRLRLRALSIGRRDAARARPRPSRRNAPRPRAGAAACRTPGAGRLGRHVDGRADRHDDGGEARLADRAPGAERHRPARALVGSRAAEERALGAQREIQGSAGARAAPARSVRAVRSARRRAVAPRHAPQRAPERRRHLEPRLRPGHHQRAPARQQQRARVRRRLPARRRPVAGVGDDQVPDARAARHGVRPAARGDRAADGRHADRRRGWSSSRASATRRG